MALRDTNSVSPAEKAFNSGKPAYSGTLGPNPSRDPTDFANTWASKLFSDQPRSKRFYDQAFSAKSAEDFTRRLSSFTNESNFANPNDTVLANDFLAKYTQSPLVPEQEKINATALEPILRQQPEQGVGIADAGSKMKFPANSTSVG
jgi:hypothetical protein